MNSAEPPRDCRLCPRLVAYRESNAKEHPDWYNGAVPSFGCADAPLLVLGLAPGRAGANRTGIAFTGDGSGDLLFSLLARYGFADGEAQAFHPTGCLISNAVRCAPPANRPTGGEITACRRFLTARIAAMPNLRAILCLGRIAHETLIRALDLGRTAFPFVHGARYRIGAPPPAIFASYHCSRYNLNTRRLTPAMFEAVFAVLRDYIDVDSRGEPQIS